MPWNSFDGGSTIGTRGSENGVIVSDEEHSDGARVTLESGCAHAPFAVTCGMYGWFFHTTFMRSQAEGEQTAAAIRSAIESILALVSTRDESVRRPAITAAISSLVDRFP